MTNDPWIHRSQNMKCATCMWFVRKSVLGIRIPKSIGLGTPAPMAEDMVSKLGRCRRHAPTMSGYPVVFQYDWCGDHKLDENKI